MSDCTERMCIQITCEILKAKKPVADSDFQIRGGGGGHPDPGIRGGGAAKKQVFPPFGLHFDLKIRGVPVPPGPSPESSTANRGLD